MTAPIGGTSTAARISSGPCRPCCSSHFIGETTMTDTALLTGQDIGEAEGAMTALLER
jgi:hypothetical protein